MKSPFSVAWYKSLAGLQPATEKSNEGEIIMLPPTKVPTFKFVDLEDFLETVGEAYLAPFYRKLLDELIQGERFWVVSRNHTRATVAFDNLPDFVLVTARGKTMSYWWMEILEGKFFLNRGALPKRKGELKYNWFGYILKPEDTNEVQYDDGHHGRYSNEEFEIWLRRTYGVQCQGFLRFDSQLAFDRFVADLATS